MNERGRAAPQRLPEREPRRNFAVLTDPVEREAFKRRRSGIRRFDGNVPVELGAIPDEQAIRQYRNVAATGNSCRLPFPSQAEWTSRKAWPVDP